MYKLISSNGETVYGVNEYVVDTDNDIKDLPAHCAMGSSAIVISTGDVYMKNSSNEWVKL